MDLIILSIQLVKLKVLIIPAKNTRDEARLIKVIFIAKISFKNADASIKYCIGQVDQILQVLFDGVINFR